MQSADRLIAAPGLPCSAPPLCVRQPILPPAISATRNRNRRRSPWTNDLIQNNIPNSGQIRARHAVLKPSRPGNGRCGRSCLTFQKVTGQKKVRPFHSDFPELTPPDNSPMMQGRSSSGKLDKITDITATYLMYKFGWEPNCPPATSRLERRPRR